mgnify:CR=1 FL=1
MSPYETVIRALEVGGISLLARLVEGEPAESPVRREYQRLVRQWMAAGRTIMTGRGAPGKEKA